MLNIYLTRHGQDLDNVKGILNGRRDQPLSEKGLEQAKEIAGKIKTAGITFAKIYTSPLQRATKTAEIVAATLGGLTPEVMPDLIEREFGILTGQPKDRIEELAAGRVMKTELITYFLDPPGAEDFKQLKERGGKVVKEVAARHADGNILLVTHGDIGKMIYAAYYDLDWEKVLRMFHFGNSDLLLLSSQSPAEEAHVFKFQQYNS